MTPPQGAAWLRRNGAPPPRSSAPAQSHSHVVAIALGLLLLGAAVFFRLHRLTELPGSLYYDEAYNGVDALRVLAGERPIFFSGNNGREPLFIYLQAVAIALLGPTPTALRIVAATAGAITVALAYLAGRELHGPRAGYVAAFAIATSYWHVSLSRLGLRPVLLPLAEIACLYFAARSMRTRSLPMAAIAGLMLGLAQYTYGSARLFPVVVIGIVGALWLRHRADPGLDWSRVARLIVVGGMAAALVALPLAVYLARHDEFLFGRVAQVALGNPDDPRVLVGLRSRTVPENAMVTLEMFGLVGDQNPRHNLPGRPVFDPATFAILIVGVVASLRQKSRWIALLYLPWTALMLLPAAVAVEAPHFLRTVGALPPIFLLVGVGADRLVQRATPRGQRLATVALAAILAFGAVDTYRAYFVAFAEHPDRPRSFDVHVQDAVDRVRWLREQGFTVWVITPQPHPAFDFLLAPHERAVQTDQPLAQRIATMQNDGAIAWIECFGCGDADVHPYTIVATQPAPGPDTDGHVVLGGRLVLSLDDVRWSAGPADGTWLEIRLRWHVRDVIGTPYHARLLLADSAGNAIGGAEHSLFANVWPTTLWQPGDRYATYHPIAMPLETVNGPTPPRLLVEIAEEGEDGISGVVVDRVDLGPIGNAAVRAGER